MTKKQTITLIVVALLWALCFPLIESGHRAASPLQFAAIRSFIAGLSIIIPIIIYKRSASWLLGLAKPSLPIALTYTAMGLGGMFLADGRVPPGISTVIANTQPIFALILAWLFLKESMSHSKTLGIFCSFIGIIIISFLKFEGGDSAIHLTGISFILMGAIGTAAGNIFIKKTPIRHSRLQLVGVQFLIGSIVLAGLSIYLEGINAINWHSSFTISLITLATIGTSLPTYLWFKVLKEVPLSKALPFTFLTPIAGMLIGLSFFDEEFGATTFLGSALVLLGVYLSQRSKLPAA